MYRIQATSEVNLVESQSWWKRMEEKWNEMDFLVLQRVIFPSSSNGFPTSCSAFYAMLLANE